MAIYQNLPPNITRVAGPSSSSESDISENFDYSGLDDHIKRQDQIGALHSAKYGQLYGGDVAGSVEAGQRIRGLLKQVQAFSPNATEADPYQRVKPLALLGSYSMRNRHSSDTGEYEGEHPRRPSAATPAP